MWYFIFFLAGVVFGSAGLVGIGRLIDYLESRRRNDGLKVGSSIRLEDLDADMIDIDLLMHPDEIEYFDIDDDNGNNN